MVDGYIVFVEARMKVAEELEKGLFEKCVKAKEENNEIMASMYALECSEIRKIQKFLSDVLDLLQEFKRPENALRQSLLLIPISNN